MTKNRIIWKVVVGITALLLIAYMAIIPSLDKSRNRMAEKDVAEILDALSKYIRDDISHGCPSISTLKYSKYVNDNWREIDPWGNHYVIECDQNKGARVRSAGLDGIWGTTDDISAFRSK